MLASASRRIPVYALVLSMVFMPTVAYARTGVGSDIVTTRHTIAVGGTPLSYTARAGFIPLIDKVTGEVQAKIFFVSYTVDSMHGKLERPLTFYTGGGPAAPGTLDDVGPRVLKGVTVQEHLPPPPYEMVDNQDTWLTFTDLVLIDPVGTGYSRATKPEYAAQYYNPEGDAESIAKFIRLYLRRYHPTMRQPIFVAGVSYGALRAGRIADIAIRRRIPLRGLILASSPLANQPRHAVRPVARGKLPWDYSDLTYIQMLPTFTATAFFHKKLSPELQRSFDETLGQSEAWAATEYPALLEQAGDHDREQLQAAATQMARLTGLSPEVVLNHQFRVMPDVFLRELLGKVIDFSDSRGMEPEATEGYDKNWYPVLSSIYLGRELHFKSAMPYASFMDVLVNVFLNGWHCGSTLYYDCYGEPQAWASLQHAMHVNSSLRAMITNGYYDLICPYFGTTLALGHLEPQVRARVSVTYFQAGHLPPPELHAAVARFMQSALAIPQKSH